MFSFLAAMYFHFIVNVFYLFNIFYCKNTFTLLCGICYLHSFILYCVLVLYPMCCVHFEDEVMMMIRLPIYFRPNKNHYCQPSLF